MNQRLYIDGKDSYQEYGLYVVRGGMASLVSMPPLKSIDSNDWHEEDGIDVDLSSPRLDTREVQIMFALSGEFNRMCALIDKLSDGAYHYFNFLTTQRFYRLRMTAQPNVEFAEKFGLLTIKFADDFPLNNYTYLPPYSNIDECDDYLLDGKKFTDYGVRILEGTFNEIIKLPNVKQNLTVKSNIQAGVLYDDVEVFYKNKEVKIKCLMRANTIAQLWQNYDALLYDLIRPQERVLFVRDVNHNYPFYYKSCSVNDFYAEGKIWLEFTLTVVFTRDFRIDEDIDGIILAAENDKVVITEDGGCVIDMQSEATTQRQLMLLSNGAMRLNAQNELRFNK